MCFLLACFAVAAVGGFATSSTIQGWYDELEKPAWTPSGWLFGPVWTILYLMMAFAAWLVWRREGFIGAKRPMVFFAIQLALNCLWSIIFFGLKQPGLAVIEIIALWLSIAVTILLFWQRTKPAALLLVPYLLWVSFAAALNIAIWLLNRQ